MPKVLTNQNERKKEKKQRGDRVKMIVGAYAQCLRLFPFQILGPYLFLFFILWTIDNFTLFNSDSNL